ncbi:MAG TPA: serine/threonine-protein kinase, partial [Kofleriaceae bacterium]|nr:serine/threonine-protein kinase [Kofleriaceae bacterium]
MAEVFLAQQRGLEGFDRRVAVKRILPHLADSPDFVKMFFGEAKLAAQLAHPNVVHIYEFGKVEHDYFIAMEFVDGVHAGQLFKYGEQQEKLPVTLVARIGADAANALHYAHELRGGNGQLLGLVHRDVSPANIMVSFDGVVKLCDFGIAKAAAAGDQLTNPGQVKGKYAYMSPEQTIASQLDGRSDVFSLAIVLWELLTGKYIVPRGDAVAAMRAIRDGKLESIEKVAPHVPPRLAMAITWALEPKRERRATAAEFAQALEAFLKSAPELATSMQLGGWIRARFPREGTGQMPALNPAASAPHGTQVSPGTVVSPGTMVVPGTAVASPSTIAVPGTSMGRPLTPPLLPLRRVVRLRSEVGDGTEIYTTSDLDDESAETIKGARRRPVDETAETIKGARPPRPARESAPPQLVSRPNDPTVVLRGGPPAPDEEDSDLGGATIQRDMRSPVPGTPDLRSPVPAAPDLRNPVTAAPGMRTPVPGAPDMRSPIPGAPPIAAAPLPPAIAGDHLAHAMPSGTARVVPDVAITDRIARQHTPLPGELLRRRRTKLLVTFAGLAALAFASFMIALAASRGNEPRATTLADAEHTAVAHEAGAPLAAADDAALPVAPPPLDAAVEDVEIESPPVDAAPPVDEGMAYLVVRTIPDGGTVKVGDQLRLATKQPGDPTGATTAQLVLTPGRHTVIAELAGYRPEKRTVVLEADVHTKIEIAFTKKLPVR